MQNSEVCKLLWNINGDGYIDNIKTIPKEPYFSEVNYTLENIKNIFGLENILSVYVRGSSVFDNIIEGISDLDIIVVLKGKMGNNFSRKKEEAEINCSNDLNFFTEVSIEYFYYSDFFKNASSFFLQFLLKTQSICIYGVDLNGTFPNITLDDKVYGLDIDYFEVKSSQLLTKLTTIECDDSRKIQSICKKFSKFFVRTIFAILMSGSGLYTRDIRACYYLISRTSKFWSIQLLPFYEWVIEPTADCEELRSKVMEISPLILEECQIWKSENDLKRGNYE